MSIKANLFFLLILLVCGLNTNLKGESIVPEEIYFNKSWEFHKNPEVNISLNLFKHDNSKNKFQWQKISLPHSVNTEDVRSDKKEWQGISWYRKFFSIPREFANKSLYLYFEGVMQIAKVYINGEYITTHYGGYLPFMIKIDDKIYTDKENCILVEADNKDNSLVPPGKPNLELDFNYYSGIYRNVKLIVKEKVHISDPIEVNRVAGGGLMCTFDNVSEKSANIKIQLDVENEQHTKANISMKIDLIDNKGVTVATDITDSVIIPANGYYRYNKELTVKSPKLWSPDNPNLYNLRVSICNKHDVIDSINTMIGIRSFSMTVTDNFILNGKPTKLRGTNRHQEYPYIGNALSDNAQYRDAYKIKQAGFNLVRCSHYPQSPSFLSACDELGICVINSIPGWQFFGGLEFQENSINDVRQMVRRDRNHPSIILWEASLNETQMSRSFMERAHKAVHEEFPVKETYTCGWLDDVYDVFIPARQHAEYPYYWNHYKNKKPMLIAEYGDWEYYAQNAGLNQTAFANLKQEERTSRQLREFGQNRLLQQALNFQESHNDNLNGSFLGDANWLMFDYKRGYAPDIESSGIMDIFRIPKFAFYFYASQASNTEPKIYIANYWNDSTCRDVTVFSNCDEVELSLNGKTINRQHPDNNLNTKNLKHPPFTFHIHKYISGELHAKGFLSGKETVSTTVKTPEKPTRIMIKVDLSNKELQVNKNDIIFVYAYIIDKNNTIVCLEDREINFKIKGDAELIGTNPQKAEAGISTILLRCGDKVGNIRIRAYAKGLISGELDIKSVK